jgi:hypothetical protein
MGGMSQSLPASGARISDKHPGRPSRLHWKFPECGQETPVSPAKMSWEPSLARNHLRGETVSRQSALSLRGRSRLMSQKRDGANDPILGPQQPPSKKRTLAFCSLTRPRPDQVPAAASSARARDPGSIKGRALAANFIALIDPSLGRAPPLICIQGSLSEHGSRGVARREAVTGRRR